MEVSGKTERLRAIIQRSVRLRDVARADGFDDLAAALETAIQQARSELASLPGGGEERSNIVILGRFRRRR